MLEINQMLYVIPLFCIIFRRRRKTNFLTYNGYMACMLYMLYNIFIKFVYNFVI
jgi:hypothetical protein